MFRERMPPIVSRGKSHSPTPARILTEPKHFKTTQPPQCGVHVYTFAIWWRHCVFFGGNNGTSLDCLSWVNCFAISPIASCKKQILPRDIIARWWWYSVRHQLTAAVRVARVFFSLFWETLFCNGWLWSIEGSLQTCLSFVLQTDHKMHVKVSFLLLQDQRIIKNYFFLCKGKKANLNEKCVGAA